MINQKYGVVYTPNSLADFVAGLLCRFLRGDSAANITILDPACGEGALLRSVKYLLGEEARLVGIDIDKDAIINASGEYEIVHNDAILPLNTRVSAEKYWHRKLGTIDAIIANPPWSSEKVYDKSLLQKAGYSLIDGQYDSYVLFIELAYRLLREGGVMGFIIPDSLFDAQNENLRKFLASKMHILVIARLGEKIFDEVNRATTVIVCEKRIPTENDETECFRLSTDERKAYLAGEGALDSFYDSQKHAVKQCRFLNNSACLFDIDTRYEEEELIGKITKNLVNWEKVFKFGRGVEISKSGDLVICPICQQALGYSKRQMQEGKKRCSYCESLISVSESSSVKVINQTHNAGSSPIFVGENIRRYDISGCSYIKTGISGINYKEPNLYNSPKLLIRKTGLGIYATVDYSGFLTSQTVYIIKYLDENEVPLEYYLALINSRVVYYFYLKTYGENEWKSHPYLTKQIVFSLPLKPYSGDQNDLRIIELSKSLLKKYDYKTDIMLESLIMDKYGLNEHDKQIIANEMNRLPNLSAINNMKMENE